MQCICIYIEYPACTVSLKNFSASLIVCCLAQALEAEMQGRWPRCEAICGKGQDLVNRGHEARQEIGSRIRNLMDKWKHLQEGATIRRTRLEDAIEAQQVLISHYCCLGGKTTLSTISYKVRLKSL